MTITHPFSPSAGMVRIGDATIDLIDPRTYEHGFPHDIFTRLRAEAPVCWYPFGDRVPVTQDPGVWIMSKHADVEMVNRDAERFISIDGPQLTYVPEMSGLMLVSMDGRDHVRQRRLISAGFTPRMIGKLEEQCRTWARRLVDDALEKGKIDFVRDIAYQLPMHMIADMVGIPESDRDWLFATMNTMLTAGDPNSDISQEEVMSKQIEMFEYAQELSRSKREHPTDDVWTTLSTAEVDGERLGETELDFFFMLLTAAGSETTRNALSAGLSALVEHPEQLERMRTDPTVQRSAVDEILRWSSPVSYFARRAAVDVEVGGVPIPAGDRVTIWYASANRDEDAFDDPFTFDITRSPNPYVSFGGGGPHYCLGANLAKLEIRIMLEELLARTREIEILGPPVWQTFTIVNPILLATKELPVRLVARAGRREAQ
jgi:cholest-4-en-3-one 26-monooxygenase